MADMSLKDKIRLRMEATPSHRIDQPIAAVKAVLDIHEGWKVYDECGHRHEYTGDGRIPDGVKEIEEIGLTCEDGLMYVICRECCTEDRWQTETCATDHAHGGPSACWPCRTVAAIAAALGVSVSEGSHVE